MYTVEKCLVKC